MIKYILNTILSEYIILMLKDILMKTILIIIFMLKIIFS